MSEDYKVQVSYKIGTNMGGMVNIRGNNVTEVDDALTEVREVLLPALAGFEEEAKAIGVIQAAFPTTAPVPSGGGQSASGVPQVSAQPSNGGTPTCIHGPRVHRSGADWQGWFCPADRNDPTKCKAQYIR